MKKLMILLSLVPLAVIAGPSDDDGKQCDGKRHHHHMKYIKID